MLRKKVDQGILTLVRGRRVKKKVGLAGLYTALKGTLYIALLSVYIGGGGGVGLKEAGSSSGG